MIVIMIIMMTMIIIRATKICTIKTCFEWYSVVAATAGDHNNDNSVQICRPYNLNNDSIVGVRFLANKKRINLVDIKHVH